MENKICPVCKLEIKEGEAFRFCEYCGVMHHKECFDKNGGCANEACEKAVNIAPKTEVLQEPVTEVLQEPVTEETPIVEQETQPVGDFCTNCGTSLKPEQLFCTACGAMKTPKQNFCTKCGATLADGQVFCSTCGTMANVVATINQTAPAPKRSNKVWIIIVSIVAAFTIFLCGIFGIFIVGGSIAKANLQNRLQENTWVSYETYINLYLDFSEDEIDYYAYGSYIGTRDIATIDYEVIDGDTIKVYGKEIDVTFGSNYVTFSPSFVNSESYSTWYSTN